MLTLTKKTEYALIASCHLACAGRGVVSARRLAGRYGLRLPLLMNVLKTLNREGVVRSVRGARGGYALAAAPKEITLGRLVEAVEGPPRLTRCAAPRPSDEPCELMARCPVRPALGKAHRLFGRFLKQITVSDLAFDAGFGGGRRRGRRANGRREEVGSPAT